LEVSAALWAATITGLIGIIVADLIIVDRRPHAFTAREATRWVLLYVAVALAFAGFVWVSFGPKYGGQFLAGYITEYSLSVDNLFVFMVIMSSFAVPAQHRHRVLLVGVVIALILRGILIVLGAAAIQRFAATFFVFGGFLLYTAVHVWRSGEEEADPEGNRLIHLLERRVPTTREYHGRRLIASVDGQRMVTPMLLVMLAIGTTDLLFALDSIPAVFGLTQEAYLVFTANAFALMGLRQLYFMLHGLLDRLIYLSKGLAVILGFIAVKLLLHALHETTDLNIPEISIGLSLGVIVGVLAVTTIVSLAAVRRDPALSAGSPGQGAEGEAASVSGDSLRPLPGEPGSDHVPGQSGGDRTPGQSGGDRAPGQSDGDRAPGQPGSERAPGQSGGDRAPGQPGSERAPGQPGGDRAPGQPGSEPRLGERSGIAGPPEASVVLPSGARAADAPDVLAGDSSTQPASRWQA
jgi:tellurite resistance protein TerC